MRWDKAGWRSEGMLEGSVVDIKWVLRDGSSELIRANQCAESWVRSAPLEGMPYTLVLVSVCI